MSRRSPVPYNIARGILAAARNEISPETNDDVIAGEEFREFRSIVGQSMPGHRLTIPLERAGITGSVDTTTSSTGGPFKFTQGANFLPLLRNKVAAMKAGAS